MQSVHNVGPVVGVGYRVVDRTPHCGKRESRVRQRRVRFERTRGKIQPTKHRRHGPHVLPPCETGRTQLLADHSRPEDPTLLQTLVPRMHEKVRADRISKVEREHAIQLGILYIHPAGLILARWSDRSLSETVGLRRNRRQRVTEGFQRPAIDRYMSRQSKEVLQESMEARHHRHGICGVEVGLERVQWSKLDLCAFTVSVEGKREVDQVLSIGKDLSLEENIIGGEAPVIELELAEFQTRREIDCSTPSILRVAGGNV